MKGARLNDKIQLSRNSLSRGHERKDKPAENSELTFLCGMDRDSENIRYTSRGKKSWLLTSLMYDRFGKSSFRDGSNYRIVGDKRVNRITSIFLLYFTFEKSDKILYRIITQMLYNYYIKILFNSLCII